MKLYLLGALAISQSNALLVGSAISSAVLQTYTYTLTGDCYDTNTPTTLGMNNIYYQYYSFTLTAGTLTYGSSPASATYAIAGCSHSHIYNFMAQPWVTTVATAQDGLVDSVVAYGFKMTGASASACVVADTVTTTLYAATTKVFSGAKYRSLGAILNPNLTQTAGVSSTIIPVLAVLTNTGSTNTYTPASTVSTFIASPDGTALGTEGFVVAAAENAYWDFLQTNVVSAQTVYGRGGGDAAGPCGWWVVYSYEVPQVGDTAVADTKASNAYISALTNAGVTVSMWTDNSIVTTVGAFVFAGLSSILY